MGEVLNMKVCAGQTPVTGDFLIKVEQEIHGSLISYQETVIHKFHNLSGSLKKNDLFDVLKCNS